MKSSDVQLLYALETELPSLREALSLAEVIGNYPAKESSRHPALNFAFAQATTAVIENLVLRLTEAFSLLDAAAGALKRPRVLNGGRDRRPVDDVFALVHDLRQQRVAHRIAMHHLGAPAWKATQQKYGDIYTLLGETLTRVERLLLEYVDAGLYDGHDNLSAEAIERMPFTKDDIDRLVTAANALVDGEQQ